MSDKSISGDTVEGFAAICATVGEGSTPRAQALAGAGLDEHAFGALQRRWLSLLVGDDAHLAARFARAYAQTRLRLLDVSAGREAEATGSDPTAEIPAGPLGAALPFRSLDIARRSPADSAEATLEIPAPPAVVAQPLPFSPPRGNRLQLFDTQTGRRLAVPVWVEETPIPRR